jgi:hypothetical protein
MALWEPSPLSLTTLYAHSLNLYYSCDSLGTNRMLTKWCCVIHEPNLEILAESLSGLSRDFQPLQKKEYSSWQGVCFSTIWSQRRTAPRVLWDQRTRQADPGLHRAQFIGTYWQKCGPEWQQDQVDSRDLDQKYRMYIMGRTKVTASKPQCVWCILR